ALLAPVRGVEVVPLDGHAVGRVAVTGQRSRVDVPGLDNSQMDGFALAATDLAGTGEAVTLPLGPTIAAGDAPGTLAPGTARPIMTGAPIPAGAGLVVPVEESAAGRFDPACGEDAAAAVSRALIYDVSERYKLRCSPNDRRVNTKSTFIRRDSTIELYPLASCYFCHLHITDPVHSKCDETFW